MKSATLMTRLAVYSFATLMDAILSGVLFVCTVRMAEMKASAVAVAALIPVWAVPYTLSSLAAGKRVNRRNAGWILIGACLASACLSAGYMASSATAAMYVLTALLGVATAFFFTPFQVFMKLVDEHHNKGVNHSTGLYTFSWSIGYALGPFMAGCLWQLTGWRGCHAVNGVTALLMVVGIYRLKRFGETAPVPEEAEEASTDRYEAMPDLAWMAWVFSGIGCAVMSVIRSVFPSLAESNAISKPGQGTVFLVLCGVQAFVGLGLGRGRWWMYRPLPILVFGLFGVAGLGLFAAGSSPGLYCLAAACFGVYSGSFYFYFVFHSLIHPTRAARYVSINEAVVGVTSVVGPLIGGALADRFGLSTPYLAASAALAVAVAAQTLIHRAGTRPSPGAPPLPLPYNKSQD
jgi:MFS family permease